MRKSNKTMISVKVIAKKNRETFSMSVHVWNVLVGEHFLSGRVEG